MKNNLSEKPLTRVGALILLICLNALCFLWGMSCEQDRNIFNSRLNHPEKRFGEEISKACKIYMEGMKEVGDGK